MKKPVLLFVAVVALTVTSYAQGVSFGVKAGVNFANQKLESEGFSFTPDGITSFHVGGFVTAMFSENFGLQPELLYNSVGSSWDTDADLKMNYISLPILFRYQPIELLNIHAGPQFGFLMSAEIDGEDIKDETKGLDVGAAFGAGVDLPMGLGFTARYILGLTNVLDSEDMGDATVKNNVFQVSVSYRFGGQ